ncbi:MAG: lipocalin-like domain-containing protein [Beijerinckiaceae bacterium]|nr:lipocalin-like domain-containing protein [Beijerinckiaceae bacterium]
MPHMRIALAAAIIMGAAMSQNAQSQSAQSLGAKAGDAAKFIGTWRLVETTNDGKPRPERGANPLGMITYHESGWMSAQIQPDRPVVGMAGAEPTGEEAKAALFGYTAYFGTYTVDETRKVVTHHRKASVSPGWEKRPDFERAYEFAGQDRVILRPVGNKNELVWERLK